MPFFFVGVCHFEPTHQLQVPVQTVVTLGHLETNLTTPAIVQPRPQGWDPTKGYDGEGHKEKKPAKSKGVGRNRETSPCVTQRIKGRGTAAWEVVKAEVAAGPKSVPLQEQVARLHVHAQADDSGILYVRAARAAALWIRARELPIHPPTLFDWAMTCYLDYLCYEQEKGLAEGRNAVSGMMAIFPAAKFPESYRSLKAWEKLAPGNEGHPICAELVMMLIAELKELGNDGREAADAVLFQFDGYAREQDWDMLRTDI